MGKEVIVKIVIKQLTLMKRETKAFGKGPFVHNAPPSVLYHWNIKILIKSA